MRIDDSGDTTQRHGNLKKTPDLPVFNISPIISYLYPPSQMYVYAICVCARLCSRVCVCVCVSVRARVCVCLGVCAHVSVCVRECACVCVLACLFLHSVQVYMYFCFHCPHHEQLVLWEALLAKPLCSCCPPHPKNVCFCGFIPSMAEI